MKKEALTAVFAAATALAVASPAHAQDMGLYLGGSIGQAKAKDWCDTGGVPAGFTLGSCDDKDTAWKLFAGYRFHRNFAAEASYMNLGSFTASGTFFGSPFDVKGDGTAFGVAVLGIWPVNSQFDLFGKLGVLRTEAEGTVSVPGGSVTLGENDTEAHYGLGGTLNFTRNWGLRGEWERAEKSKVDMWSVGVQYRF